MFTLIGAAFFVSGLFFFSNPLGTAETYIRVVSRMGGPRITVGERYLGRRVGTVLIPIGGGMLSARLLLALGVEESALMSLLPVAVATLLVLAGSTILAIYRASSRGEDS
ncbi:hypothetical protein ACWEV9_28555 [Streptomyces albogriseolus]|uniref:hypothetical protein n=1 Tax=Streptomyces albogriseolus TaxID=1887 RepID=UPI0034605A45